MIVPVGPPFPVSVTDGWFSLLNCVAVKAYGEAEFWLSGGKFLLIVMLFSFTLVTMAGGNPRHDVSNPVSRRPRRTRAHRPLRSNARANARPAGLRIPELGVARCVCRICHPIDGRFGPI